jgi:hypothetical protein
MIIVCSKFRGPNLLNQTVSGIDIPARCGLAIARSLLHRMIILIIVKHPWYLLLPMRSIFFVVSCFKCSCPNVAKQIDGTSRRAVGSWSQVVERCLGDGHSNRGPTPRWAKAASRRTVVRVWGLGFRVWSLEFGVWDLGFGFRGWGLGFRV